MENEAILQEKMKALKTGTTTVGLTCTDGVILASDRRATMGYFIASKDVQKVFQIDDKIAMTVAGSVADAQFLVRLLQAECRLYRLKHGRPMTTRNAASLLSNMMFQYKFFPYWVQLIVAGYDEKAEIYSLDPLGGVTEEKYTSTGSGSPVAYGVIEEGYKAGGAIKDNAPVAAKAIAMAMRRDAATGEYVDVVTVSKSGFKRLEKADVLRLIEN
ncbi:MAG: archaeal proteasome endopeptidase complex subunit beta [Candidatus Marsarchaeota archaeon]|nr:archaeal proteasome endopeptidase complex subunit beta [Candidatus Marsarchaeota archaeon]